MLREIADDFWADHLATHPVGATFLGYREHDDRMPDPTPAGRHAARDRLAQMRARLDRVEPRGLPPREQVMRLALAEEIDAAIGRLDCDLEAWTLDPLSGPQVELLQLPSLQRVATPAQGRALVARYRAVGPYLDALGANLRSSLAAGRVAPAAAAKRVARQIEVLLAKPPHDGGLSDPAYAPHDDWDAAERERFREGVEAAVLEAIRPAFTRLGRTIAAEILPRARPDDRAGLASLPGGEACYARLIRIHTSLDLAPDEIHAYGLEEIARIRAEMERLGARALGTGDLPEILRRLRTDPALHFRSREEVEAKAAEALARAAGALPGVLGTLPRTGCVVRRMEAYEEADSTIAYYREPAVDGSRPGTYAINTSAPETRPRYEAEALAYHESIPGHHVQLALAQEQEDLPAFRRHLGATAFVEGWGLYAERLADEIGLYSGDVDRIGMLSFDAWRASRLVVDTGLHALGWSRERAAGYLLENTALAANNIANEVDRYLVWPAQALAYKIGQREILALRAEAETRLGPRFELREFHDRLLANGAVPLGVLRAEIGRWIGAAERPGAR